MVVFERGIKLTNNKPEWDKDEIIFLSDMIGVVESVFNANCDTEEAEEFVTFIYNKYKNEGSPCHVKKWLKEALKESYLYVDTPPKWVEEEPSWPYMDGRPMVFITQYTIIKNSITEKYLTWDTVIYVFGQNVKIDGSNLIKYKLIEQIIGFGGTGER